MSGFTCHNQQLLCKCLPCWLFLPSGSTGVFKAYWGRDFATVPKMALLAVVKGERKSSVDKKIELYPSACCGFAHLEAKK